MFYSTAIQRGGEYRFHAGNPLDDKFALRHYTRANIYIYIYMYVFFKRVKPRPDPRGIRFPQLIVNETMRNDDICITVFV